MSVDVSQLAIKVTSEGIKETSAALGGLSTSAVNAERKVSALMQAMDKLEGKQKSAIASAQAYGNAIQNGINGSSISATLQLTMAMGALTSSLLSVSKSAQTSSQAISYNTSAMGSAHAAARGLAGSLGALWLTYGSVIPLAAGAAIGASFKQIVLIGKDVEHTLEGIRVKGQESIESINNIREAVMELGKGVYAPKEIALAFETMVLAGLSAKQALVGISDALNLAIVGGTSIEKSAYTIVQVGTALGYTAENYNRIADVIAMTAAASMSSVETLSEAFKSGSVVGKLYGVTLVDIGTSLAALSNLGIQGSAAGTSLKNFYKELASSSEKVKATLSDMKLVPEDFKDAQGNYLGVLQVVEKLEQGLENLTEAESKKAIAVLSNERGMKTAIELLDLYKQKIDKTTESGIEHSAMLKELRSKIEDSYGFAAIGAAQMSLTVESQFKSVANTLQTVFLAAFQKVSPELTSVATSLKTAFNSPEFTDAIQTIAIQLAKLAVILAENAPLIVKLIEGFLLAKSIVFVIELFSAIRVAFIGLSTAAAAASISLGPVVAALAAAGAAYAYFSKERDNSNLSTTQQNAIKYSEDYSTALEKEAIRLNEQLTLIKEGKNARDAETESMYKQQLAMAKLQGDKAKLEAEGRLEKAGLGVTVNDLQVSRDIVNRGGMMTSAVKEFYNAQANLAAVNSKVDASFEKVVEGQKAVMAASKALEAERLKQVEANKKPSAGTGVLSGKIDHAALNDEFNSALKEIQGRIEQEKRALKYIEEDYQSQYKQGIIGDISLIKLREDAEVKSAKNVLSLLKEKLAVSSPENKKSVKQDIENQEQKVKDQEVESTHEATLRMAEYYSKLQDNILKTEAEGYKLRGKYVDAFLSEFGEKHAIESKHIADNIVQEQNKIAQSMAQIANGNSGQNVYEQLAESTFRLDVLLKQTTASSEAFSAGIKTNSVKEAVEAFDKLHASMSNTLKGVQTSTEGLGMGAMLNAATEASKKYTDSLTELAAAQKAIADAGAGGSVVDVTKSEEALAKMTGLAETQRKMWAGVGESISKSLTDAFGTAGTAAGGMIQAVIAAGNVQEKLAADRAIALSKLNKDEVGYADKLEKVNTDSAKASSAASIKSYGNMASAAKGFFKEGTTGYKVLETAERAFRVLELAMDAKATAEKIAGIFQGTTAKVAGKQLEIAAIEEGSLVEEAATIKSVVNSETSAGASLMAGVAKCFEQMGIWGFVGAAAIIAFMAAMGLGSGGGGAAPDISQTRQKAAGTGPVLGDETAKSESVSKGIEILEKNSSITLPISQAMLKALHDIRDNIGGLTTLVIRSSGLTGTYADRQAAGESSSPGFFGIGASSTTLVDQGILLEAGQTIGNIIREGLSAQKYSTIEEKNSGLFGLFSSDDVSTSVAPLEDNIKKGFARIIGNMRDGVLQAADALGLGGQDLVKKIDSMAVGIKEISLLGMKAADIPAYLESIFSKFGDDMAMLAAPQLESFQRVGEGMFQTVIRVVNGVETAQEALDKLGITMIDYTKIINKQGDVGAELVRQSIMNVEGLGDFHNVHTDAYTGTSYKKVKVKHQYSDKEIAEDAYAMANPTGDWAVPSKLTEKFDEITVAVDVLIPATDTLVQSFTGVGKIMENMTGSAEDLAAMYESLLSIRRQMKATGGNGMDLSVEMLRGAGGVEALASGLSSFFDNFFSDSEKLAANTNAITIEFSKFGLQMPTSMEAFKALVQGVDTTTVAGQRLYGQLIGLAEGFNQVQEAASALASKRNDMQIQILDLEGKSLEATARRRQLELAALDESLRPLQTRIYALQDEADATATAKASKDKADAEQKSAMEAAAKAQQEMYQKQSAALKTAKDQFEGFTKSLLAFRDSLLLGSLSTLSPEEQYLAAKSKFESTATRAQAGDVAAIGELQAISQAFLDASKKYNASTSAYATDFDRVLSSVNSTIAYTVSNTSILQAQLSALETINNSILSLSSSGTTATAAGNNGWNMTKLKSDYADYFNTSMQGDVKDWAGGKLTRNFGDTATFVDQLGRVTTLNRFADAMSVANQSSDIYSQWQQQYGVDGSHASGLEFVPFDGYRAELHKGERVQTASQARQADNKYNSEKMLQELIDEIRTGNKLQGVVGIEVTSKLDMLGMKLDANRRELAKGQTT